MDIGSVEGLILTVLFVLPGGVGDAFMRERLRRPRPDGSFTLLLRALGWSAAAVVLIEFTARLFGQSARFGEYLLVSAAEVQAPEAVVDLSGRYLLYFGVALLLPVALTFLTDLVRRKFTSQTPDAFPLDELFLDLAPPSPGGSYYVGVETESGPVDGWLLWKTEGDSREQALVLRDFDSVNVTLIPVSSMRWLRVVEVADGESSDVQRPGEGSR